MVANEYECPCHPYGTQAYRKRDLRCFVYYTVVEYSLVEDGVIDSKASGRDDGSSVASFQILNSLDRFTSKIRKLLNLGVYLCSGTKTKYADIIVT